MHQLAVRLVLDRERRRRGRRAWRLLVSTVVFTVLLLVGLWLTNPR